MDSVIGKGQNFSTEDAMKLAKSDAGKKLFAALQNTHSQQIQNALDQAQAGDLEQLKKTMSTMLSSEEIQSLLKNLGG